MALSTTYLQHPGSATLLALQDKYELGLRDKKQPLLMALPKVSLFFYLRRQLLLWLPCPEFPFIGDVNMDIALILQGGLRPSHLGPGHSPDLNHDSDPYGFGRTHSAPPPTSPSCGSKKSIREGWGWEGGIEWGKKTWKICFLFCSSSMDNFWLGKRGS